MALLVWLPLSLLSLSLLPTASALQCVRLQPTGNANSVAAAATALGALPVPHADGSLELVGGGPGAPTLESVVAQLVQADGGPVELVGPPEPLFESEGSTAGFAPLLVSGALRIRPVQDALPASVTSSAPQPEDDGALPLHLLDGDGVFMLTTSDTFHQSTAMLIELAVRPQPLPAAVCRPAARCPLPAARSQQPQPQPQHLTPHTSHLKPHTYTYTSHLTPRTVAR